MNIENLLVQRFKVISDYPDSPFMINDILTFDGIVYGMNEPQKFVRTPEKYPLIFKQLNWWEKRSESEMPKYLKHTLSDGKTTFHEVIKWDLSNPNFIEWRKDDDFGCFGMWSKDFNYMPCTESEYLANKA